MSEEELIETLRAFEKNRVEQLEEPAKNLFYAIMKIADERDRLNNIINKIEEHFVFLKMNSTGGNKEFFEDILDFIKALRELKGSDKDGYDTYTANVLCDIQSDFEEILRGEY